MARDSLGVLAPGRGGGPGNPYAQQVGQLRTALIESVNEGDMREVASSLIAQAKSGNVRAIKELFDRLLGRPVEADLIERIERLEAAVSGRADYTGEQTA